MYHVTMYSICMYCTKQIYIQYEGDGLYYIIDGKTNIADHGWTKIWLYTKHIQILVPLPQEVLRPCTDVKLFQSCSNTGSAELSSSVYGQNDPWWQTDCQGLTQNSVTLGECQHDQFAIKRRDFTFVHVHHAWKLLFRVHKHWRSCLRILTEIIHASNYWD